MGVCSEVLPAQVTRINGGSGSDKINAGEACGAGRIQRLGTSGPSVDTSIYGERRREALALEPSCRMCRSIKDVACEAASAPLAGKCDAIFNYYPGS